MLHRLKNLKALRFRGRAADFLKAYTTNLPHHPRSAFVDVHGRIVAMADQALVSPEEAIVVVGRDFEERLRKHLSPYLFLYGTEISDTGLEVYWDLGGSHRPASGETSILQKAGQIVLSPVPLEAKVSPEAFRLFRVRHNLPLQGVDFDQDVLLNVADDDRISYDKGCYLGQEIVARIHFRGKPAKRIVVRTEEECGEGERERMTSRVWEPEKNAWTGFLQVPNP